ncbi:Ig-like domain-containing protein [Gelidibacter salicanalis]|uniref:Ig-like domain-containing protein n=1 Tax=Gelidibacter salicanalis TaxID=291193 RepID=A0A934KYF8_9FLAO|nr:Ig-like domain-containing protein [Gelidibacter salicanalis]MBJ7882713.1 Ig-like domain-containing protein [Gelidibacter salicanalis]
MKFLLAQFNSPQKLNPFPIIILLFFFSYSLIAQQLAFPNAYGAGAYAKGGRGGKVVHVTSLLDVKESDSRYVGTLRWALKGAENKSVSRTIVFDVSGIIDLYSDMYISNAPGDEGGYADGVTIAGQSAPLGGITITGGKIKIKGINDFVIRYVKFRSTGNYDGCLSIGYADNLILDHLSGSHTPDIVFSVTSNGGTYSTNHTIQNCLMSNSKNGLIIGDSHFVNGVPEIPYGSVSIYRNAYYNVGWRIPAKFGGSGSFDVINNVAHNWSARLMRFDPYNYKLNHIGNYYQSGYSSISSKFNKLQKTWVGYFNMSPKIYQEDNYYSEDVRPPGYKDNKSLDWTVFYSKNDTDKIDFDKWFVSKKLPIQGRQMPILSSQSVKDDVLNLVGSSQYIKDDGTVGFHRDKYDLHSVNGIAIKDVSTSRGETIEKPVISQSTKRPKNFYVNNPHIPEVWFSAHVPKGQDHNDIAPTGYTWLEMYLNQVDGAVDDTKVSAKDIEVIVPKDFSGLYVSETVKLDVVFTPANTTNKNGVWSSKDDTIATVDSNGLVTGVAPGKVSITFTAADGGHEDATNITVFPKALQASAGIDQQICKGESTTLTASGGTNYVWSTGETTTSIEVTPKKTTTYTVKVSDKNGQSEDAKVTVTVNPIPVVDAGNDMTINSGEVISLSATGAKTYQWSTGDNGATITVSPKSSQTYTVTGMIDGCEATDTVKVIVVKSTKVVADVGKDQNICKGTTTTLTATGGSTYLWNTGATAASIDVAPEDTTTYTVTAFDSTGDNSDTDKVTITVNSLTVDAGNDITITAGESVKLTAEGAETYKWSTGDKNASITVSPTVTKTYTVTGTSNSCKATDTVKVTVLNTVEVVANAGADQSLCEGASTTLTATGGSTYLWSTGETTSSIKVAPNETTVYEVTVYDSAGNNSDTDEVTITVNPLPSIDAGSDKTITAGESILLTATGAKIYKWSTGGTSASITVSPTATTTYTVTGSLNGCEVTDTVKVKVLNTTAVVADAGEDQSICEGSSVTLTATGGSTYLWSTGDKTQSITFDPGQTATYTVTAYDGTGKKSDRDDVIVTVNPSAKVNAGNDVTINAGDKVTLTATGAKYFMWSTGDKKSSTTVRPTVTTTYSVRGKNDGGCEGTDTVKVIVKKEESAGITADAGEDQSMCEGSSVTLTATGGSTYLWSTGDKTQSITVGPEKNTTYTVTAYNGTGKKSDRDDVTVTVNPIAKVNAGKDVTINAGDKVTLSATGAKYFMWSTGDKKSSTTVRPTVTTIYSVRGKNDDECEGTDTVRVIVKKEESAGVTADAGEDQSMCEGSSVTLTATGGSTYLWSTGAKTQSITVGPEKNTTYTVTAYNGTGKKSDRDDVTVTVNPSAKVNAGNDVTINAGDKVTLSATGAKYFMWSTGDKKSSTTVRPTVTTIYSVRGKNDDECEGTDTVRVIVKKEESAGVTADAGEDQSVCEGSSVTLTATGGSTYLWSTGAKTQSITFDPGQTATYTVTAYDGKGKISDRDDVTVTVNPIAKVNAGKDVTINAGEEVTLSATGAKYFIWSTGDKKSSIRVQPTVTTTYSVRGKNDDECEGKDKVTVTVISNERAVADAGSDHTICGGSTVALTATGGDAYLWSTGETTPTIVVSPTTTSKYSVTAYVGKTADTDEVMVYVDSKPNVNITNGTETSILEGEFITLSATGAKRYKWSNGVTDPNIAVSPEATKSYNVVGSVDQCFAKKSITVNVYDKVVANAGNDVTICKNETTILTAEGPENSDYLWSTGETTKSITVDPKEDTEYSVMVYHDLDSDTDSVVVKVEDCKTSQQITNQSIAVLEGSTELKLLIHPNPTHGLVNINISGLTNQSSSIHLYDLSGKSLYNETINNGKTKSYVKKLNLSDYAAGIYLLQLVDNQRVITKKIVVR